MTSRRDIIIYCAGIMDGEGTISFQTQGEQNNFRKRFTMEVKMSEKPIIELFHETFGGWLMFKPRRKPHYKDLWGWRIGDKKAVIAFQELLPFLRREAYKETAKLLQAPFLHTRLMPPA